MGIGDFMTDVKDLMIDLNPSSGLGRHWDGKLEGLQKQKTETMMETCLRTECRDGAIRCPIPRKNGRSHRDYDFRTAQDISDFIVSKGSPPYFMGSPPVRASNPLVYDAEFSSRKVQSVDQSLGIPIPTKSYSAPYRARGGSVTKA